MTAAPMRAPRAVADGDTALAADNEYYPQFNYRWAQYIRRLKQLLETGAGNPFQRTH